MITLNGVNLDMDIRGHVDPNAIVALSNREFDYEAYEERFKEINFGRSMEDNAGRVSIENVVLMAKEINVGFAETIEKILGSLLVMVELGRSGLRMDIRTDALKQFTDRTKEHFRNPDHLLRAITDDLYLDRLSTEFYGIRDYARIRQNMHQAHRADYEKLQLAYKYLYMRDSGRKNYINDELRRFLRELIGYHPENYDTAGTDWE